MAYFHFSTSHLVQESRKMGSQFCIWFSNIHPDVFLYFSILYYRQEDHDIFQRSPLAKDTWATMEEK